MTPRIALIVLAGLPVAMATHAQQPSLANSLGVVVYPSEGQSSETQASDEGVCYQWARQATGIDPMLEAVATAPPVPQSGGGRAARGVFRGAARAALIADIADADTNEAAWAGGLVGGVRGAREHQVRQRAVQQQAERETDEEIRRLRETFNKGFAACLEGKKYTVK